MLRSTCEASTSDYKDKNMNTARLLLLLAFCSTAALTQAQTAVPHTFQDGTPAEASEVNENFDALAESIDEGWGGRLVVKSAGVVLGAIMADYMFITRQGYRSHIYSDGRGEYSPIFFEGDDCSGNAYSSDIGNVGELKNAGLSSYWVIPLTTTLETPIIRSFLERALFYDGGPAVCAPGTNPQTTLARAVPNDPAVTGIQNKGAKGGEEYAWPITYEMR